MKISFIKCQGSGNDFILVDETIYRYNFSEEQRSEISKALCRRSGKIGADGILFYIKDHHADARMRIFNPDGSEASMCGNGIRCIARHARDITKKESMYIAANTSLYETHHQPDLFPGVHSYSVKIHTVSFNKNEVPVKWNKDILVDELIPELSDRFRFTAVSMGNPHIVAMTNEENMEELIRIGKIANTNIILFPEGVNVSFCRVKEPHSLVVTTYERGVGITKSCGTAMSASAIVSCKLRLYPFGEFIDVYNNGGMVRCRPFVDDAGKYEVILFGNATFEYEAEVEIDFSKPNEFSFKMVKEYGEEKEIYYRSVKGTRF